MALGLSIDIILNKIMHKVKSACHLHSPGQKQYHHHILKCGCHAAKSKNDKKTYGLKSGECCGHHNCHITTNKEVKNQRIGTDGDVEVEMLERARSNQQRIIQKISQAKNQKNREVEDPDLERLRDIIAKNANYFQQRTKVCCDVKPNKYRLELPSKTGHTTYQHDFTKKNPEEDELDMRRVQSYKVIYPFYDQTNYQINYVKHELPPKEPRSPQQQKPSGEKEPRFLQTQYKEDYRNWKGKTTAAKIEPPHSYLMGNMPFEGKSVYMADFVPKKAAIQHFHHTNTHEHIFPNMKFANRSTYEDEFVKKRLVKQKGFKPKDQIPGGVEEEGQFNTQYGDQYYKKKAEHCHYSKVLSLQQIQRLMKDL